MLDNVSNDEFDRGSVAKDVFVLQIMYLRMCLSWIV